MLWAQIVLIALISMGFIKHAREDFDGLPDLIAWAVVVAVMFFAGAFNRIL